MTAGGTLEIISTGIVCAVGLSSEAAYTAIRANVSGYAETDQVLGGLGFEPIIGASVPLRPPPKPGQELPRLERLAELALEECLLAAEIDASRTALLLGFAEPHRGLPGDRSGELLSRLCTRFGLNADSRVLAVGNVAAFAGLELARQLLATGRTTHCIVGGVDSLLNERDIGRLTKSFRLGTESNGQGVVPGEAAAFVVVARWPGARGSLATVVGVGSGRESDQSSVLSSGHPTGRGLIAAWSAAVGDAGAHERDVVLRVSDMTGERYAGIDSMLAVSRFFRSDRDGLPILHPAENVGGTGAAAGGLSLAVTALGLSRDLLASDGLVLCEGSSEDGQRGAALLRAPAQPPRPGAAPPRPRLPLVVDEHVEEAAFLFALRQRATSAPHHDLRTLALLDARLQAHVDGILAAGAAGFARCAEAMAPDRHGELASAAVVAFAGGASERIEAVLDRARADLVAAGSVVAALAFLPWARVEQHMQALLDSADASRILIGIRAAAVHRQPSVAGQWSAARAGPGLAALLRAQGELRAGETRPAVERHMSSEEPNARFWATWAATLLGSEHAPSALIPIAETPGPWAERALELAAVALPFAEARRWLDALVRRPDATRIALQLAGRLGDPSVIPWLLSHLPDPTLGKLAGESFTLITGVDLVAAKLDRAEPGETGPNDDPDDEDVALDPDDELPLPDPDAIQRFWERARDHFQLGTRYLCGKELSEPSLQALLRAGTQRQRRLAALALALRSRTGPLFETRAPAIRQTRALGMPSHWTI